MASASSVPPPGPPAPVIPFRFATAVSCPLCAWSTSASSPSYCLAQTQVVEGLLRHMDTAHAEPERRVA